MSETTRIEIAVGKTVTLESGKRFKVLEIHLDGMAPVLVGKDSRKWFFTVDARLVTEAR